MLHTKIKLKIRKKPLKPRLPKEAVRKLRSHPVIPDKGMKEYDRRAEKKRTRLAVEEADS